MKSFNLKFSTLFAAVIATMAIFSSCQKDTPVFPAQAIDQEMGASDRANGLLYGVTVFNGLNPSVLVTMDPIAQAVIGQVNVTLNGTPIPDLKGVCCVQDRVFVSTGFNAVDAISNLLLEVDPQTGQATFISQSNVGTVSDIDFNPLDGFIYGLRNNSNTLVTINGANFQNYALANFVLPLSGNSVARGLAITRTPNPNANAVMILKVSCIAMATVVATARLYSIPFIGGNGVFETQLGPNNQLAGGHCGLGFVGPIGLNGSLFINRNANIAPPGLNFYNIVVPVPGLTNTVPTAILGFNFEDLSNVL